MTHTTAQSGHKLGIKIDVDTARGTREGVPRLLELFARHGVKATFLFSLGPDNTGRALRRVFRPGFLKKVSRTSVVEHYGLKTLGNGVLWPGPDIGKSLANVLRETAEAGHEVGVHCWDHVRWQDHVEHANPAWTLAEMQQAHQRFTEVFGVAPHTFGAAGWQMNTTAWTAAQDTFGYDYTSHSRAGPTARAFLPIVEGRTLAIPDLPTTLPTLDEILGYDGCNPDNAHTRVLALTAQYRQDHVFTGHAELEGQKLLGITAAMLAGWQAQGYAVGTTRAVFAGLDVGRLPALPVGYGEIPGRSGRLAVPIH